jgi:hypothetical protein
MTSLFLLKEGEVLKQELPQLKPARLHGQQVTRTHIQIGRRCKWVFMLAMSKLCARGCDPSVPGQRRGY